MIRSRPNRACSVIATLLAVISAACGGGGGDSAKTPTAPSGPVAVLTTVTVSLSATSIQVGQSATASAAGADQNGGAISLGSVTWSTASASIATVNASGAITGVAPGQTQVIATAGGKQGQQTITVVAAQAASVQIAPATGSLTIGQTASLTATIRGAGGNVLTDRTVSWFSSNLNVLSGTTNGNSATVTALAAGTATVTASVDGVSGIATFTITAPVAATASRIDITPSSVTLDVGQTATVTATVRDASGNALTTKIVSWATSDGAIVGGTVSGNSATLQAVASGSAVVSASVDGVTGTLPVTVRVTAPKPVASIAIAPASYSLAIGSTVQMVATLRDALGNVLTGRTISWSTSNTSVASGTATGNVAVITGVSAGSATIIATSEGITGVAGVSVVAPGGGGVVVLSCSGLAGGAVYGQDGQYLGRLTNAFDPQSINNTFGAYGSQFSSTSMYNQFSKYGSQFATYSAYNQFTNTPPMVIVSAGVAYVTKNIFKLPRVDPDFLRSCVFF